MTSSVDSRQCDYLHLNSFPSIFASERGELAHINQQLSSLDEHISQLSALRETLRRRSCELQNSLSPIRVLPVEVLSYIFRLVGPGPDGRFSFHYYRERIGQALVLSSVSSYFRRVAFDTPVLWSGVQFRIPDNKTIDRVSSLLRHCAALSPYINVTILGKLDEEHALDEAEARSVVDVLFAPDVTRKIQELNLSVSTHIAVWADKLEGPSFPVLDALNISTTDQDPTYDFGSLSGLTRLDLSDYSLGHPIIAPPSVQHLDVGSITSQKLLSLLHQCPDLVQCRVGLNTDYETMFSGPVTLERLEQLDFQVVGPIETGFLADKMILPSLDTLTVEQDYADTFIGVLPLCRNISATLTTLVLNSSGSNALDRDSLYQVFRLPFPRLTSFELWTDDFEPFASAVQALSLVDQECSKSEAHHLPALRSILLHCGADYINSHSLPELLTKWRIGEAFNFRLELFVCEFDHSHWHLELQEELKSTVLLRPDVHVSKIWPNL